MPTEPGCRLCAALDSNFYDRLLRKAALACSLCRTPFRTSARLSLKHCCQVSCAADAGINRIVESSNRMAKNGELGGAFVIGISGVSSSGKTTLARLLRDIFPCAFILHEDDFYKTDGDIPTNGGFQDWDCIDALDLAHMREALVYIREKGMLPPTLISKEDQNSVGDSGVSPEEISKLREQAHDLCHRRWNMPIAIIDGFLLYSEAMKQIRELLDVKLFLRTYYKTAKARREARSGYVTLEGFWEDPPGYVDKIVWPNYVKDHSFLFGNRDVEGDYDQDACAALQLYTMPERAQESMTACLHWAFDVVRSRIEQTSSDDKRYS